ALTEFTVEAIPASEEGKPGAKPEKIKIVRASADINLPERALDPKFQNVKAANSKNAPRVTGPVDYAIDGKDNTAWGIDAGPGLRNQSRKAVFNFEKPVSFPAGTVFHIYLAINHGGANSDDNENNNLGRIRVSATTAADPVADPLPHN